MELARQVKEMIVEQLRLKLDPAEIGDDVALFGEGGMGFDSVDALELVLGLEQRFGVEIPDEQVGRQVLESVRTMTEFVQRSRRGVA